MTIFAEIEGLPHRLEFEDGTPAEVIQRVVKQQLAAHAPSAGNTAAYAATAPVQNLVLNPLAEAVTRKPTFAGTPGYAELGRDVTGGTVRPPQEMLREVMPQPRNGLDRTLGAVTTGAASALMPGAMVPGLSPVRAATIGGVSGGVGQATTEVTGSPLAGALAGFIAGNAGGFGERTIHGTTEDAAQNIIRDVSPEQLRAATALRNADDFGLVSQYIDKDASIHDLAGALAKTGAAGRTQQILQAQPEKVEGIVAREVSALPGEVKGGAEGANALAEAVRGRMKAQQDAGTAAFQGTFDDLNATAKEQLAQTLSEKQQAFRDAAAGTGPQRYVAQPTTTSTAKELVGARQAAADYGKVPEVVDFVKALQQEMVGRQLNSGPLYTAYQGVIKRLSGKTGGVVNTAENLDLAISDLEARLKDLNTNSPGSAKFVQGQLRGKLDELTALRNAAVPAYEAADAAMKRTFEAPGGKDETVAGPLGRLAATKGADAKQEYLFGLFNKGTVPGASSSDIRKVATELNAQNPGIFRDAAKTWLTERLFGTGGAFEDVGGLPNSMGADRGAKIVGRTGTAANAETNGARQGFRDIVAGVAEGHDLSAADRAAYIQGADRIVDVLNVGARAPNRAVGSPVDLPTGTLTTGRIEATSKYGLNFGGRLIGFDTKIFHNATIRFLDKAMSGDPVAIEKLIRLGKEAPMSKGWQDALSAAVGAEIGIKPAVDSARESNRSLP